jgi:hypothetical protein
MRIRVEGCIGHRNMQMPSRLLFDGHRTNVVETIDQWHGSDCRYVKVRCDNGCLYILRYDALREDWELTMFESVRAPQFLPQLLLPQLHGMKAQ